MSLSRKAATALTVAFVSAASAIAGGTIVLQTAQYTTDAATNPQTRKYADIAADFGAVIAAGASAYWLGSRRRKNAEGPAAPRM